MAKFTITKGADSFEFDTSGNGVVRKNAAAFGTWGTTPDNKLVATPVSGSPETFDVTWKFDKNELQLFNGAAQLVNFHGDRRPRYELINAVLVVHPDSAGLHQFKLNGEWDLEADLRLAFTPGGSSKSIIDGTLSDVRSRFIYRFGSTVAGHQSHQASLVFAGRWRRDPDDPAKLNFLFARANGTEDTFVLPGTYQFSSGDNQLIYQFNAPNRAHSVTLVGTLRVSSDFQISYSVANQPSGTEIVVDAVFDNGSFSGEMQLAVQRPTGGKTVFTVSGSFTALKKPGGKELTVGYSISGGTGGTPTNIAINGTYSMGANGSISFTFLKNATSMTIGLTASQIKLGNFGTANASAVIKLANGQLQSVEFMFGITFPMQSLGAAAPPAINPPAPAIDAATPTKNVATKKKSAAKKKSSANA